MAYIPGYRHDVFVSYAHGDNRAWVERLTDDLRAELQRRVGCAIDIWLDEDRLARSQDFRAEIPERLRDAATLLFLPSPTYVRSEYCVRDECRRFEESLPARRARTRSPRLANERFAFRCPMLPVANNAHWALLDGLTDIPFCDEERTFGAGSADYDLAFRQLSGQLVTLLQLMRNDRTPVFVYPRRPTPDVKEAHAALTDDLGARGFRVLPETEVNFEADLRESALAVFLFGGRYERVAERLTQIAASRPDQSWVVWASQEGMDQAEPNQAAFLEELAARQSARKTDLGVGAPASKLKEEVLALLQPDPLGDAEQGKPRVYLVFNTRDAVERLRAGRISRHFWDDFHFDYPDNRALHTRRLSVSDYVLLVWGRSDETWCSLEFADMVQASRASAARGLCLYDPRGGDKVTVIERIRRDFSDIHIEELFEPDDDVRRLEPFFRRRPPRGLSPNAAP